MEISSLTEPKIIIRFIAKRLTKRCVGYTATKKGPTLESESALFRVMLVKLMVYLLDLKLKEKIYIAAPANRGFEDF